MGQALHKAIHFPLVVVDWVDLSSWPQNRLTGFEAGQYVLAVMNGLATCKAEVDAKLISQFVQLDSEMTSHCINSLRNGSS